MQSVDSKDLNPNIRRTVQFLRDHGYQTVDSGDGCTHDHSCDRSYPYVSAVVPADGMAAQAERLQSLLEEHGIEFTLIGEDGPEIEVSYQPGSIAILDLRHVDDSMLSEPDRE